MATAAQIIANRGNATLSTGPMTEAGKARAGVNALRYGGTSSKVVLPHESQEEFDKYRSETLEHPAPANEHERTLTERVVETYWRMQRMYRVETAFMKNRMEAIADANTGVTPGDEALALMLIDPAEIKRVALMQRYIASAERAYNKAVSDLAKAQKERRRREVEDAWLEEATRPDIDHSGSVEDEIGFVSQRQDSPPPATSQAARTAPCSGSAPRE